MYSRRIESKKAPNWLERHPEVQGVVWLVFCISQLLALVSFDASSVSHNFLGFIGHLTAGAWYFTFGVASFAIVAAIFWYSLRLMFMKDPPVGTMQLVSIFAAGSMLSLILSVIASPAFEAILSRSFGFETAKLKLGGVPFSLLYNHVLYKLLNSVGTMLIGCSGLFLSLAYFLKFPLTSWFESLKGLKKPRVIQTDEIEIEVTPPKKAFRKAPKLALPEAEPAELFTEIEEPPQRIILEPKKPKEKIQKITVRTDILLPSLDLLNNPKKSDQSQLVKELKSKADLLEETLLSFGIEAKVGQIHCGPTITSFEVHPAVGVKIGKIKNLEHDIALNLEAKAIRIIAPIPGKPAVGIEVPNSNPQEVSFKEILIAYQQKGSPFRIPMLLGKGVNGDLVIADLAKMPHCIIAGATGSGKSVCINSIVMSILMCAKPDEIRLLMIDPKKVELTQYTNLPHMLAPVITEPHNAALALNWLVKEMEKRYEILKLTGQRNIDAFNKRKINVEQEKSFHVDIPEKMPYYVALIDELADLMMVSSQDIETPIARIAQMARAVGIHMILATQRPSREVITGLIRANFPARIAFKVASRINSQIILDDVGAETLLGNGDMLFLMPGSSSLIRAQGVFVRDDEISKTIEYITSQSPPQYLIQSFDNIQLPSQEDDEESGDSLFDDAKNIVLSTGNASTTFLQRKLKIGYARAASLMDMLEARGVVGPQEGARARRVLFPKSAQGPEDLEDFDD
ncbi:MAG: DNA translocase FtsK 4TM domain-containing protein [Verrucomicrobia bacterium]|nr:DNA translocase FtsK 4TM domain-containing protein [Verrucomicrobiota bacterium]